MQSLPPGMDIIDQEFADIRDFNSSTQGGMASGHNAGDYSGPELTPSGLKAGFLKPKLAGMEDEQYEKGGADLLYVDVGGYVMRGNTLDRL